MKLVTELPRALPSDSPGGAECGIYCVCLFLSPGDSVLKGIFRSELEFFCVVLESEIYEWQKEVELYSSVT